MKKYQSTIIFYVVSVLVIYLLSILSPNQQDGGPGLGSLAIVLFVLAVMVMAVINAFKGIKQKEYFLLAGIHLLVLLLVIGNLFL